jgi:hypothetical protein
VGAERFFRRAGMSVPISLVVDVRKLPGSRRNLRLIHGLWQVGVFGTRIAFLRAAIVQVTVASTEDPMHDAILTLHARHRLGLRGIRPEGIDAAIDFGRLVRDKGADIFTIGWREVERAAEVGVDLSLFEGLRVVCDRDGSVITTYWRRTRCSRHTTRRGAA